MPSTPSSRLLVAVASALALLSVASGCAKDPGAPVPVAGIVVVQGDAQVAQAGRALPTPIVLRALDSTGAAVEGRTVTLVIGSGGGTVTPTSAETSAGGEITATWTLGPSVTSQSLLASAAGFGPVTVNATALVPAQVVIAQGNNQSGRVGTALPTQLVVRVLGAGNVPLVGIPVAFQVTAGGGSFTPQTASTNATGEVTVRWTLGTAAGANSATVQVSTLDPVTVSATATP